MSQENYKEPESPESDEGSVRGEALAKGDYVRWQSSGGVAQGQIERISRENPIKVPDSSFTVEASSENPFKRTLLPLPTD